MSNVKVGPLWDRAVFDGNARAVKYRLRTVCRFDDVRQVRILEWINPFEQEQLLNIHPEVQKAPRDAELWLDLKDKRAVRVGAAAQAGLLLTAANDAAGLMKIPLVTERKVIDEGDGSGGNVPAAA